MKSARFSVRRIRSVIVSLLLCGFFSAITATSFALTLTFASNSPPSGLKGDAETIYLEELEKAANGKITIKPFWAESLLKGTEIMKGIQDGIVDIGQINIAFEPRRLMRNSAMILITEGPVGYANRMAAFHRIYDEVPELNEEFAKFQQRVVYMYNLTSIGMCFFCGDLGLDPGQCGGIR
jgi:TRAP-type C4-dicarboxylate transport system substrate-binding protein